MTVILYNGKKIASNQACFASDDRGLTLGHGLFETILIKKGTAPALDYHWQRLETSAPLIRITLPFTQLELTEMLRSLIKANDLEHKVASARITITHGESARGILPNILPPPNHVIVVQEYIPTVKPHYSALIVCTRKNEHNLTSRIKSISYLDNILAKQEAIRQGYDEAILLNTASQVADGAITNIFMVKNNQIYTPPIADGALPGVIRTILLQELHNEWAIIERSILPEELLDADEVFITNALIGVQPVSQINDRKYHLFSVGKTVANLLKVTKNYL